MQNDRINLFSSIFLENVLTLLMKFSKFIYHVAINSFNTKP